MVEQREVVIVGAGFAGVYLLHQLRDQGFDVVVLEAGSDLGGIWHWNCYPGARVDTHVPIYEYSSPELWADWYWDERFPDWQALRRYFDHVDAVWDIRRDVRFSTRVTSGEWRETDRVWRLETDGGDLVEARWLIACTGFAAKAHVPDLPGRDDFAGEAHHTAHWPQEGLDLTGRKVGVIGVGASGVQVIQEAGAAADHVTVFQRTPILALPMHQQRLSRAEQDAAKVDYPTRFAHRRTTAAGFDMEACGPSALAVSDSERVAQFTKLWEGGGLGFWTGNYTDVLQDVRSNRTAYDFWCERTRERITDPGLADLVAPTEPPHPFGVKRPSLEQNYYEVLGQENVSVVDLHREPIERVLAEGVETAGRTVELDVLVHATGFDAVTGGLVQLGLTGTDRTLEASWATGVHTQVGAASSGFPNLLFVYGPQSPSGFCNGPTCAEVQGDQLVDCLVDLRDRGVTRLEARPEAEAEWRDLINGIGEATLFPQADSWYMGANIPGKPRELLNFPGLHIYQQASEAAFGPDHAGFDCV